MIGGTDWLISKSTRQAVVFVIPFGLIGVWRWTLLIIRYVCWSLYRPIHPKKNPDGTSGNRYTSSDVTIIVPTINTDEALFHEASKFWMMNKPNEILVVTTVTYKNELQKITRGIHPTLFRVLTVRTANKRLQLMKGIHEARTPIVALSDDDALWTPKFLEWMLAPFDDHKMGGVGSRQEMVATNRDPTFWEVVADFRLSMRIIDTSASTFLDGGMSCLSGRTAVYRTKILQDTALENEFVNEKWLGKYRMHSGDDKFFTRWLVKNGWNMQMQNHKECCLLTTFKDNHLFLKQVLRWTRNTWRSDIRSVFVDRVIWRRYPYVAFSMVDKFFNPFPVIYSIAIILTNIILGTRESVWYIVVPIGVWVFMSRLLKLAPHIVMKPSHFAYIPFMVAFQYIFPFLKLYALFTLSTTDWGSRADADVEIDLEDDPEDFDDEFFNDEISQWDHKEKPKRSRPALYVGWIVLLAWGTGLGYLGLFIYDLLVNQPHLTEITSYRAPSSVDRGTGGGVYDSNVKKTFLTFAGKNMDPMVMEYDHSSNRVTGGPFAIARAVPDFHNYPKMVQDDNGHLMVFWTDSPFALYMAKNSKPHTVNGNWTISLVDKGRNTYPCAIKSSSGDIYLFSRRTLGVDYRPLYYVKSTDNGETWLPRRQAIDSGGMDANQDPTNLNEIYADCPRLEPASDNIPERFSMGWTKAGGGFNTIEHNGYHKDAHFAYFYPDNGTFTNVQGEDLGNFIDYDEMKTTIVFDSGPLDPNNKRIVDYTFAPSYLDGTRYPILLFNFNRTVISSTWNGTAWSYQDVVLDTSYNLFDVQKIGRENFRLLHADGAITSYETGNAGKTWMETSRIRSGKLSSVSKVITIENAHPDMEVITMENDLCYWGECEKSYSGIYKIFALDKATLWKPKLNTKVDTFVDVLIPNLALELNRIGELSDAELDEFEVLLATWFVDYWQTQIIPTGNRTLNETLVEIIDQKVTYDDDGTPTNTIRYKQRLEYFDGPSFFGSTEKRRLGLPEEAMNQKTPPSLSGELSNVFDALNIFPESGLKLFNLDDTPHEEIALFPFQDELTIVALTALLEQKIDSFHGKWFTISTPVFVVLSRDVRWGFICLSVFAVMVFISYIWCFRKHRQRYLTYKNKYTPWSCLVDPGLASVQA